MLPSYADARLQSLASSLIIYGRYDDYDDDDVDDDDDDDDNDDGVRRIYQRRICL